MSFSTYKQPECRIGGASLVSHSTRGLYAAHQGAPFMEGTRKGVLFVQLTAQAVAPGGIDSGTISNQWPFSLSKANNNTNCLAFRFGVTGQYTQLHVYKSGETSQTFVCDAGVAYRIGGCIPALVIFDGRDITLCQLGVDRYATGSPLTIYKTEHELPFDFSWDDYQDAAAGYCTINRLYPGLSGTPVAAFANLFIASFRDDVTLADVLLDNDQYIAEMMANPADWLDDIQGALGKVLSPELVSATGVGVGPGRAITPGSDKLRCVNTGVEWTTAGTGTGGAWARERFAPPAKFGEWAQAVGSHPIATRINDRLAIKTSLIADHNNVAHPALEKRDPDTGRLLAPGVPIVQAASYTDNSSGDALTRYNGRFATAVAENHQSTTLLGSDASGRVLIAEASHTEVRSNVPDTGDSFVETGSFGSFDGSRMAAHQVTPANGYTGGRSGVSYLAGILADGVGHWMTRRFDTTNGQMCLLEQSPTGAVTSREITISNTGQDDVSAPYPCDIIRVGGRHLLAVAVARAKTGGVATSTIGNVAVLLDLKTRAVYAPRTGADITGSLGTIPMTHDGLYLLPGEVQDAMIAATFDGAATYERRASQVTGGSWFAHTAEGVDYVGCLYVVGDLYASTKVGLAVFRLEGTQLVYVRDVDLTATASTAAGETDYLSGALEEWQTHEHWVVSNTGGDLVVAIPHGDGADYSTHTPAAPGRLGTHVSLVVVRDWWRETPTQAAHANVVAASDYGFASLRPFMVENSKSMGLGLVSASHTLTVVTTVPESQTVFFDFSQYLPETPVASAAEIVAAINADATQTTARTAATDAANRSATIISSLADETTGLQAIKDTATSTDGKLTSARAAKLDTLPDSGVVATADDVSSAGGTVTAEDISKKRTWTYPTSGSELDASNYVKAAAGQTGPVTTCFDLNKVLEENVVVASITSETISSSGATVGTPVAHTSKRKVNVPLTNITATTGNYTVTLTIVATDSEQYVVRGVLQVE